MLATTVEQPLEEVSRQRSGRYAARHVLWEIGDSQHRSYHCGRSMQANGEAVTIRTTTSPDGTRSSGFGGVQSCGSVWVCPVCSAKIAEGRRLEIAAALDEWQKRGGKIALATFTISHGPQHRLKTLWDALTYAWSKTTSGRGWAEDRQAVGGKVHWIRTTETTHGWDNGWHVHIHALLLLPGTATDATARYLEERMFDRWERALKRKNLSALRWKYDSVTGRNRGLGANVELFRSKSADEVAAAYVSKSVYHASYEVARGDLKASRYGNRTPFAILAAVKTLLETGETAARDGSWDELDLWREWERASRGRRQMAWSRGLRAELIPDVAEQTDDELAAAALEGEVEAVLDRPTHQAIIRARADYRVLEAFERSRHAGVEYLLTFAAAAARIEAETAERARTLGSGRARYRRRPRR